MSDSPSDAAMEDVLKDDSDSSSVASQQANVEERLDSLHQLDLQITEILERGSAVVETIASGKQQSVPTLSIDDRKEQFRTALQSYNSLVEEVNRRLRVEVKMLHSASHTELMPLSIPVQASEFGREKEDAIFKSLEEQN